MENEDPPGAPKSEETSMSQRAPLTCIDSVKRTFPPRMAHVLASLYHQTGPSILTDPGTASNSWVAAEAQSWLAARRLKWLFIFRVLKSSTLTFRCSRTNSESDIQNTVFICRDVLLIKLRRYWFQHAGCVILQHTRTRWCFTFIYRPFHRGEPCPRAGALGGGHEGHSLVFRPSRLDTRRCGRSPALPIWKRRRCAGFLNAEMSLTKQPPAVPSGIIYHAIMGRQRPRVLLTFHPASS